MRAFNLKRIPLVFILCFLAASLAATADAAQIKQLSIKDNLVELEVEGAFTYTIYNPDPYRLVLEMPDVTAGPLEGRHASKAAGITELQISQNAHTARLEVLLESPAEAKPAFVGNKFLLSFQPPQSAEEQTEEIAAEEQAEAEEAPEPAQEEKEPAAELPQATSVTGIGFEQQNDATNLVIKGDGELKANVFSLPARIVVDIPAVKLKSGMPKKMVPPVKAIRSGAYPDKLRLVVDLKGDVPYEVISKADTLTLSLPAGVVAAQPQKEAAEPPAVALQKEKAPEAPEAPAAPPKSQKISLDFQKADIVPIFMLLGEVSGYNVVVHPTVSGNITLKLKDVPWEQALDIVLDTFSLGKMVEGNIMKIAPLSQFATWRQEKERLKEAEERTEDLTQDVIKLNYATAADIATAVSDAKLLSPRGNITKDTRMNTLIVKDIPSSIGKIKDLVKIMDGSKQQVMIEAQIVTVSNKYTQNLGIRWGGSVNIDQVNAEVFDFSINTPVVSAGPTAGEADSPVSAAALSVGTANAVSLKLSLEALETVGKSKSIANPRVLTMDNEQATIESGKSIPVQTTTAEGTTTQYVSANLNLKVKPRITPDGYVQLEVTAANDELGGATAQGSVIDRKNVQTKAIVKDGETLVLGGVFQNQEDTTDIGIPLLSRIPIFGWLFKTRTVTGPNPSELLILITPKIIKENQT